MISTLQTTFLDTKDTTEHLRLENENTNVQKTLAVKSRNWIANKLYLVFGIVFSLIAPLFLMTPSLVCKFYLMVAATPLRYLLASYAGAFFIVPLTMIYSMQRAVAKNQTDADVHQLIGCIMAIGSICLWAIRVFSRSAHFGSFYLISMSILQLFPCIAYLFIYGFTMRVHVISNFISSMVAKPTVHNIKSIVFRFVAVECLMYTLVSVIKPSLLIAVMWNGEIDAFSQFIARLLGILVLLLSMSCIFLSNGNRQSTAESAIFERLNTAVLIESIVVIATTLLLTQSDIDFNPFEVLTNAGWVITLSIHGPIVLMGLHHFYPKKETMLHRVYSCNSHLRIE